jgi:hypothetical protein
VATGAPFVGAAASAILIGRIGAINDATALCDAAASPFLSFPNEQLLAKALGGIAYHFAALLV